MKRLRFAVRSSSSGADYDVEAVSKNGTLSITCSCAAGSKGSYCKHRIALLGGDVGMLSSGNLADVEALAGMVAGTAIEAAYVRKVAADLILDAAKAEVKEANSQLARSLLGLP